ncbi:hypothetical protein EYF80_023076 [Liparis tanakae]|uniref:Uncharacterized protein n=1 Tax=Liparis tanakae TaxID=230148 RepID=A0A4Z2HLQ5_9TELE|nr:hypothetical protein EYF80_023076 [Liparis tanakae]
MGLAGGKAGEGKQWSDQTGGSQPARRRVTHRSSVLTAQACHTILKESFQGSGCECWGGSILHIIPETLETSGKAEIYLRRLRRMHDLCLTNMAFSQRLLDKETDSLSWQEERGNRDLIIDQAAILWPSMIWLLRANRWQARKDQRGDEPTISAPDTHPETELLFGLYIWELFVTSSLLR